MLYHFLSLAMVVAVSSAASDSAMRTLLDAILNSTEYSSRVRPIKDTGNVLTVTVDMYLIGLNDIDEVEQKLQSTAYLKVTWSDHFLSWTPASYNNIEKITVKQDRIWKPDLALANAYDTISGLGDSFMYVTITYLGLISWYPYQVFDSSCTLDMTYFPFDSQSCDIQFVTWSSTKEMINIVSGTDGLDTSFYETNANWDLLGVSSSDSSTSTTSGLSFKINIKRKPFFFLLNFIIPIVCLSILNLFVFVLPSDSGEKTGYAIVLFLSFAIFLLIVTEIMPEGMKTVPVMSTYLLIECVLSTIIVFVTIIQLRLHNQDNDTPVPHFLKSFVGIVFVLKRKLCLDKNSEEEARKREEETEKETSFQAVKQNGKMSELSDSLNLSTARMPGKPRYFSRRTRISPEDLNSGNTPSGSRPIDGIEIEEAESPQMTDFTTTSRKPGKIATLKGLEKDQALINGRKTVAENQNSFTGYKYADEVPKTSRANKNMSSPGRPDYNISSIPGNRIRLHQNGVANGLPVTEKLRYKFDLDSTDIKHNEDDDDISSILTLDDEDVSWADVATAMDVVFFMIFFTCNMITTAIAFILSAVGGNT